MSISFQCEKCGKLYEVPDNTAGKSARCKQCGQVMKIPAPARAQPADPYGIAEPAPLHRRVAQSDSDELAGTRSPRPIRKPSKKRDSDRSSTGKVVGGVVGAILVVLFLGLRVAAIYMRAQRANNHADGVFPVKTGPSAPSPLLTVDRNGPIAVPPLPDPGPGRDILAGITFREVHLPGGSSPGFAGKMWLYTPSGPHEPRSLPCVMITGAGSNLLTGMDLGDGDRPEHLPYVQAGFAVLAFELDGAVHGKPPSAAELDVAVPRFLAARAGLVNAHIALEFLLAKVPEVDPERIYAAGHSSAGTLAMLFAENEPRIKACAAFAPAIDLEQRFGAHVAQLQRVGIGDLAIRYSPKNNESKLSCPILLFHARDDSSISFTSTEQSAQRLQQLGKDVTLVLVNNGNHYDSMIQQGIPRAIAWFQAKAGMPQTVNIPPDSPGPRARPAPRPGVNPAPQPGRGIPPRPPMRGPRMIPKRKMRP
jgi:dienelactone hydrolase/transcription elongation factor Elf1